MSLVTLEEELKSRIKKKIEIAEEECDGELDFFNYEDSIREFLITRHKVKSALEEGIRFAFTIDAQVIRDNPDTINTYYIYIKF